ncbi:hypothetical protein R1sor_001562 [Riccia sorocarpa]|uniref:SMP domain-containing protein n=1 Tax=Riccia sorocarpa TaxID=122646 RepID=A0ABD3GZF7_9MARC
MSQEQLQRPVTYGDVFPITQLQGQVVADHAITMEDAALMQSAEAMTLGKTQKGGAASAMQAAASKNVEQGMVDKDAHSLLAEFGMTVAQTAVPGAVMDVSYVAGSPIAATAYPTPTDPSLAAMEAVTIGEALEAAAVGAGDKPIDESDASAILSAEARATGISAPIRGGVGAVAQSAAELNQRVTNENEKTTLADVLTDATMALPTDKVVTREDAEKIIQAELRHKPASEGLPEGGVGAAIAAAADLNERIGLLQSAGKAAGVPGENIIQSHQQGQPQQLSHLENKRDTAEVPVGKYYPLDNSSLENSESPASGKGGATPASPATPPATPQSDTDQATARNQPFVDGSGLSLPFASPVTATPQSAAGSESIPSARDQPSVDELMAPLSSSADNRETSPSAGDPLYSDAMMTPLIPSAGDEATIPRSSDQPSDDQLMTPLLSSSDQGSEQPSTDDATVPAIPSARDHPSVDELSAL